MVGRPGQTGPDFLSIGAARSGTTWLHQRLLLHPDIFVTPIKEIHYFDIYRRYPCWHWIRLRRTLLHLRRFSSYLFNRQHRQSIGWLIGWGLRYFLGFKSRQWYQRLFDNPECCIAGEMTPAYALLDEDDIRDILSLNPNLKVIFQMRDPIDRAWSQVVMHLDLHQRPGQFDNYLDEIMEVIRRDEIIQRSMYTGTIDAWEKHVERQNICYLFFDDIERDPRGLLRQLFGFLEADDEFEMVYSHEMTTKVGQRDAGGREIPAAVEKELARIFLPMLVDLEGRFADGYPTIWKSRAENALNHSG